MTLKKKLCFVVQRYGLEVNGGAELQCRQLAEHMNDFYDIEIVTTKAKDYVSWENEYLSDIDVVNGITVRRFPNERERALDQTYFNLTDRALKNDKTLENGNLWIDAQGPFCPQLVDYIRGHREDYDVFVFFTYLYYTSVRSLPYVADKAILVPTAHDELPIHQPVFREFFKTVQNYFFETSKEEEFVQSTFGPLDARTNEGHGGVGVDLPDSVDAERFKTRYSLDQYVVYVGRIERGKRCDMLFKYFMDYTVRNRNGLKLVLMGKADNVPIPDSPCIVNLGYVSDQDKFDGIAGAKALIQPSPFESLSIVLLEAMALHVPVVVNARCEVTKEHCRKSDAGLYYGDYFEFEGIVNYLLQHPEIAHQMGENGYRYVQENYTWERVVSSMRRMIEGIHGFTLEEE